MAEKLRLRPMAGIVLVQGGKVFAMGRTLEPTLKVGDAVRCPQPGHRLVIDGVEMFSHREASLERIDEQDS